MFEVFIFRNVRTSMQVLMCRLYFVRANHRSNHGSRGQSEQNAGLETELGLLLISC